MSRRTLCFTLAGSGGWTPFDAAVPFCSPQDEPWQAEFSPLEQVVHLLCVLKGTERAQQLLALYLPEGDQEHSKGLQGILQEAQAEEEQVYSLVCSERPAYGGVSPPRRQVHQHGV